MIEQRLTIINKLGLHARAAAKLAQCSNRYGCSVSITKVDEKKTVDGKSIMALMLLAAGKGTEIIVTVEGEESNEAMQAITELVNDYFGEGE